MKVVLDTHTLIWFMEGNLQLSSKCREAIMATGNKRLVSVASFYEIAVKINIGKLHLGKPLNIFYQETIANQIDVLPISEIHLPSYTNLPIFPKHKDPFDRMIIATAIAENATLLSADGDFNLYKELVDLVW